MVWGKRNTSIAVSMTNERQRQTYYGAINLLTREVHLKEERAENGVSYHRSTEMQEFLTHENAGLPEEDWKVTCLLFAPNAPEQNSTEDL